MEKCEDNRKKGSASNELEEDAACGSVSNKVGTGNGHGNDNLGSSNANGEGW